MAVAQVPAVPDSPYFPEASPQWVLGASWIWDADTGNGDGIVAPGERIEPRVWIRNVGTGTSKNVTATLAITDTHATVVSNEVVVAEWAAGVGMVLRGYVVDISGASPAKDIVATVTVVSTNPADGTADPAVISIVFSVVPADPPSFTRLGEWIWDGFVGNGDDRASPGEQVEPRVRLRNDGGSSAANVTVALTTDSPIATLSSGTVTHTSWPVGEARKNDGLVLAIGSNAVAGDTIPITVTITADAGGPWVFTYNVAVTAPAVAFEQGPGWVWDGDIGNFDLALNAGERTEVRARVQNTGDEAATNVVATLTVASGAATIESGTVTHGTWPAGEGRANNGFIVQVDPSASGTLSLTLTLTADNGGPWVFTYTHDIAAAVAANFVQSAAKGWVWEGDTGDGDGNAEPGETIELRARMYNEGTVDAVNVVAVLSTTDENVTVTSNTVTHATWPGGVTRNNNGFVVDLEPGLNASSVTFTVYVTADVGGPWSFTVTVPVAAAVPFFEQGAGWVWDGTIGHFDLALNAGERTEVRARVQNTGGEAATNVVATLTVASGAATIDSGTVTHGDWPGGEARNNNGFIVQVDPSASGTLSLSLTVTADNGGPWVFTYTHDIAAAVAANIVQSAAKGWAWEGDTGDGDGNAEPGETIEVRARMYNDGTLDAVNVVAVLSTTDENVTVTSNTVTHATWPGGVTRNNNGFVVDLGAGLTASSVNFTVDVTADGGGSWQFTLSIPVTFPAAPAALRMPTDVDADGIVSIRDILTVAAAYGDPSGEYVNADVNGDGVADLHDMLQVHEARTDTVVGAPTRRRTSHVPAVEGWLRDGRNADDGSAVFRHGLPALHALLLALKPAATALLPNYPNPFNPETWIPFDLAEASDITIRIYDVGGQVIRRLDLGYVDPGMYRARNDAVYWDGRNEFGESVASGVYVYEIRAGGQRDMRRMVVRK